MQVTEHNNITSLCTLIDDINRSGNDAWIIACVKKDYLKPITNEAFLAAIRPSLHKTNMTHIYWGEKSQIYIAWEGEQKAIYKNLRSIIGATMMRPGLMVEPASILSYFDPRAQGEQIKIGLDKIVKKPTKAEQASNGNDPLGIDDTDETEAQLLNESDNTLVLSPAEHKHFNELKEQKLYRKQIHILVLEDQAFSQKLICEIIRGVRPVGRDTLVIDAVSCLQEAWKLFIKKGHDIAFIDLIVPDGSGHALAQAIKELDPMTHTIIVTANNYDEELSVAQQNNVNGFIAKPYNKKQIIDHIEKYMADLKARSKGTRRATIDRLK